MTAPVNTEDRLVRDCQRIDMLCLEFRRLLLYAVVALGSPRLLPSSALLGSPLLFLSSQYNTTLSY